MARQKSTIGGVLTNTHNQPYSKHTVSGEIVPDEDTVSTKRRADYQEAKKKLASKSTTSQGLPAHQEHPDYVFLWVTTDMNLSNDNASLRLLDGWEFTTKEDQPVLHAALSLADTPLVATTGSTVEKIRWKELVSMKLRKGYHDAMIEHNHVIAPVEADREFVERTVDAFNEYGSIDPNSKLASGFNPNKYRLVPASED